VELKQQPYRHICRDCWGCWLDNVTSVCCVVPGFWRLLSICQLMKVPRLRILSLKKLGRTWKVCCLARKPVLRYVH